MAHQNWTEASEPLKGALQNVGIEMILKSGLYLLEGVPVTVCVVATVAWEGSPGVAVSG
jgi:hypothetical protein